MSQNLSKPGLCSPQTSNIVQVAKAPSRTGPNVALHRHILCAVSFKEVAVAGQNCSLVLGNVLLLHYPLVPLDSADCRAAGRGFRLQSDCSRHL